MAKYDIRPVGDCFGVYDEFREMVGGPYDTADKAKAKIGGLVARDKRNAAKKKRPCMKCQKEFLSWGIGNRLCLHCRQLSEGMI